MKHFKPILLLFLCLCTVMPLAAKKKAEVIAHRGYWKQEGSAQNSIRALELAKDIGVYGSEFDVHLTSDNVAVVFHDNEIQGKAIQTTPYAELKNLKLANGESLPTLEQYLTRAQTLDGMRLIFELKAHATPERNREAARLAMEWVKRMNLEKRTEYITFSLDAGKEFIRLAPDSEVYYLNGELSPKELKELGFAGLDYHYDVMRKHPEWFDEAHRLGLKVNVWTVDDPAIVREMLAGGADYITTNQPEEVQQIIAVDAE